ncbi:DNA repair protein RecO [Candidatus Shapirobacteria bacterium CG10_big_fil_rev_8_21_14_0_10_40_9]|uniref:DNA repair protein RecO n=1 Tax=Candidatus Shapirobacteria bacterium CG10_big_fil_rev_8_21_14_0_10_40_9 TaxID=1974888 RepID=A0A2M8L3E3_9BACT|nr:MAG: DNA repair protein RecO [Candidatus Shapirobacteria bacterium CG10_big_fil_rev_8_21_14_0_10_40_9]
MGSYKTEGIILKRTNFGEADRILTIYTKHFGKLKVLAKGIRKPTSKKSPSLELFNWVKILASRGKNLDIISECQTVRVFRAFRKDLKKIGLAFHFCELVERLTAENVKNRQIFNLLAGSLLGLEKAWPESLAQAAKNFEQKILEESGFWPRGKKAQGFNLENYIEKIIEKRLKSKRIFKYG